jgi:hypothetical protein
VATVPKNASECRGIGIESLPTASEDLQMPMIGSPLVAARPDRVRPVRLPEPVKAVITAMVEEGLDWAIAARQHNVQLQRMRKWFGRPECISYLRKMRAQFRSVACAGNEAYLVAIRRGDNSAAAVHAIRTLEQLENAEIVRPSNAPGPGIQIVIRHARR